MGAVEPVNEPGPVEPIGAQDAPAGADLNPAFRRISDVVGKLCEIFDIIMKRIDHVEGIAKRNVNRHNLAIADWHHRTGQILVEQKKLQDQFLQMGDVLKVYQAQLHDVIVEQRRVKEEVEKRVDDFLAYRNLGYLTIMEYARKKGLVDRKDPTAWGNLDYHQDRLDRSAIHRNQPPGATRINGRLDHTYPESLLREYFEKNL